MNVFSKVVTKSTILIVTLFSLLIYMTACSLEKNKDSRSKKDELLVILFTSIGNHFFDDSVFIVSPDSLKVNTILKAESNRSFTHASASSLKENWVITVHELTNFEDAKIKDQIYLFNPNTKTMQKLTSLVKLQGTEGEGFISPDGSRILLTLINESEESRYSLWLVNLYDKSAKALVYGDKNSWYKNISWNPNSDEAVFVRFQQTHIGIEARLIKVNIFNGTTTMILDEPIIAGCFSPEGKRLAIWTKDGLEMLDLSSGERSTIYEMKPLLDRYEFRGSGLAWSHSNTIAFSLFDLKDNQSEIWIIESDGQNPHKIYSQSAEAGNIIINSFLK